MHRLSQTIGIGAVGLLLVVLVLGTLLRPAALPPSRPAAQPEDAPSPIPMALTSDGTPYPWPLHADGAPYPALYTSDGTPYPPPPILPTPAPSPSPVTLPVCRFPRPNAAPAVAAVPTGGELSIGAPVEVLRHTSSVKIAGWLPDNQRLLIARGIPRSNAEQIETLDLATGTIRFYAERMNWYWRPLWMAGLQAVAFLDYTETEGIALRLSRGDGQGSTTLAQQLASPYIANDAQGRQVSMIMGEKEHDRYPALIDLTSAQIERLDTPIALADWHATTPIRITPDGYRLAWSPDGRTLALHNNQGLALLDLATRQVCTIDLQGFKRDNRASYGAGYPLWAVEAQWSPDSRYLALQVTAGELPFDFMELVILDTVTGELTQYHTDTAEMTFIKDIAWDPSSPVLAVFAQVEKREGVNWSGLYLLKMGEPALRRVLPETLFWISGWGQQLAWSPDGQTLAVSCPGDVPASICLLPVRSL